MIKFLINLDKKTKWICLFNCFLTLIALMILLFTITFYTKLSYTIVIITSIVITLICLILSLSDIYKTIKLNKALQELEEFKLYNQTLTTIDEDEKAFKHDFRNIIQAIGGYINNNDMNGLKTYYSELFFDFQKLNTLSTLTPEIINNPAVYSILYSKYNKAHKLGITINLNSLFNFNELNMKIYEFTRILGILLDNAIEASYECNEKIINIDFRKDNSRNRQLVVIENTYKEKDINLENIFNKGFSSKPKNTGIGLWEVRQILNKNKNLNLYTNKDNKYFKQQLEIYETIKSKL